MKLHSVLYDAETEARAALVPGATFVDAIKPLKNMREIRFGDTGPVIANTDLDFAFTQAGGHINL